MKCFLFIGGIAFGLQKLLSIKLDDFIQNLKKKNGSKYIKKRGWGILWVKRIAF